MSTWRSRIITSFGKPSNRSRSARGTNFSRSTTSSAARVVDQLRLAARGVAANELHRNLRPFDRCARNSGAICEIAEASGDCAPAAAYTRLGDAGFTPIHGLLVDYQVERHVLR